MIEKIVIENPKRYLDQSINKFLYPYYAGFSASFVSTLLQSCKLKGDSIIGDPWNGAGTTTSTALRAGYNCWGSDLNPIMVIAAKAGLYSKADASSLAPLMEEIIFHAENHQIEFETDDPVRLWFTGAGGPYIRKLERAIFHMFIDAKGKGVISDSQIESMAGVAAFYYVALFRTIKVLTKNFKTSNPTWIKIPKAPEEKKRLTVNGVLKVFRGEIFTMLDIVTNSGDLINPHVRVNLKVVSSLNDHRPGQADLIITSPPYCTRIDYAIATLPELAVIGYKKEGEFKTLREKLIGRSTISKTLPTKLTVWGAACNRFLEAMYDHSSKASKTYYFKNHLQYFDSIYTSLGEIYANLKTGGGCVLVAQDSYYKNIHNDLPSIITEMSLQHGLELKQKKEFISARSIVGLNSHSSKYRSNTFTTESVLCFSK